MGKLHKLRNIKFFTILFRFRDKMMSSLGLFEQKKKLKQNLFFARINFEDWLKKKKINCKLILLPNNIVGNDFKDGDIVVSVTSYGKRVHDALPYMLYSLLNQTILPKKIVVYLDHDNWSLTNLPWQLKRLQEVGVDVRFCKDIRSYKKLIPALVDFPNNAILTLDDDMYYHRSYMEWMTLAYNASDKKTVLGQWGYIPTKKEGQYIPYNEWPDCKLGSKDDEKSFIGCCGICYPPHIFDDEILREDLFMQLCPIADDIWFWAMQERLNITRQYIDPWGRGYHSSVNRIEEYDRREQGTLTSQNLYGGKNNQQLLNVVEYYKL